MGEKKTPWMLLKRLNDLNPLEGLRLMLSDDKSLAVWAAGERKGPRRERWV